MHNAGIFAMRVSQSNTSKPFRDKAEFAASPDLVAQLLVFPNVAAPCEFP